MEQNINQRENMYNKMVAATIINLSSFSKENDKIDLGRLKFNSKIDKYLFIQSRHAQGFSDTNVYIGVNLIDYFKFKKGFKIKKEKEKGIYFYPSFLKRAKIQKEKNQEMLEFVANAYNLDSSIFIAIYDCFYGKDKDYEH